MCEPFLSDPPSKLWVMLSIIQRHLSVLEQNPREKRCLPVWHYLTVERKNQDHHLQISLHFFPKLLSKQKFMQIFHSWIIHWLVMTADGTVINALWGNIWPTHDMDMKIYITWWNTTCSEHKDDQPINYGHPKMTSFFFFFLIIQCYDFYIL